MGFANNLFPAELLPKITIRENGTITLSNDAWTCGNPNCNLCNDTPAKKETTVEKSVKLADATKAFKSAVEGRVRDEKATLDVSYYSYSNGGDKARVSVTVPSAYGDGVYASFVAGEDELKQIQDAVYAARVAIAKQKVGTTIKNEDVYPF